MRSHILPAVSNVVIAETSNLQVMINLFLMAMAGWLLVSGCATNTTVTPDGKAVVPPANDEPRRAEVGMTREEIESIYGRPARVFIRPNGETWHYDNRGMAWIPFNFGYRYRQSNFTFDQTGHLRTFRIDQ
jgi:outer membrane protein assembly factor BamE (lipoprotein component of BamABCDE complex)